MAPRSILRLQWHPRWNALGLTFVSQAIAYGIIVYSFSFYITPFVEEFSVPRADVMMIVTAALIGMYTVAPVVGIVLDKCPLWLVFCSGAVIFSATLFLISLSGSFWTIFFLYALFVPIGLSILGQLGSQVLIVRWFKADRGLAFGISAVGYAAGAFLFPIIVTALISAYGWRASFQILAVPSFFLIGPAAWIILKRNVESDVSIEMKADIQQSDQTTWTTRQILRSRDFWIISSCFSAITFSFMPVLTTLGDFAQDLGISQNRAAISAAIGAVALGCGKFLFGRLMDFFSHRLIYCVAMLLMSSGIIILSQAGMFPQLVFYQVTIGFVLTAFGEGAFIPLLGGMFVERFGAAALGRVLGLSFLFIQFGMLSPFITGIGRDFFGSYGMVYLIMLVPIPIAMISTLWLSVERRDQVS